MNRQHLSLALGIALLAAVGLYLALRPTEFERAFDGNLAHFPLAASLASRDAALRTILLQRTERAFDEGGWRAANSALRMGLAEEVEFYADDEHINAISRAELPVLLKLESNPLHCKSFLLAGSEPPDLPEIAREQAQLWSIHLAAIENGFDRKTRKTIIGWRKPSDTQVLSAMNELSRGPVAMLTQAELKAEASYLDGDAELLCSAAIKRRRNLLAMEASEAADATRNLIGSRTRIDFGRLLSTLCRDLDSGLSCSQ